MTRERPAAPRRRRGSSAAAVASLLLLAGLLAACSPDVDASGNKGKPIRAGDRYVALGDSYTSGPGLGEPTGADGCQQTDGNYPHLLAAQLDLDLVDVSCGGATTNDLTRGQRPAGGDKVDPQLDAVTEGTDLVTLSIGANNEDVYGNLVLTCARLAAQQPDGEPCTDAADEDPGRLRRIYEDVKDDIVRTIGKILDKAPDARIVIVSYPQFFPNGGEPCPELPLAAGDYPFAHEVMARFVAAQTDAAREAGTEFIDVWTATEGHDICAPEPWAAGATPDPARGSVAYHSYGETQRKVVELLSAQLEKTDG